jgi:hypothetical protein
VRDTSGIVGQWWVYLTVAVAGTWAFWLPAIALGVRFDSVVGLVLLLVGLAVPGVLGIVVLHGWVNFTAEIIVVPDPAYYALWFVLAVVIVARWGPQTMANVDEVPHPPLPSVRADQQAG